MSDLQLQLGRALQAECHRQDLYQSSFAGLVGVSQKHVSAVFLGKVGATVATYDHWAAALGMEWRVQLVERTDL